MPVQLKVKDMMIPIEDYAVTTVDKPLKKVVLRDSDLFLATANILIE